MPALTRSGYSVPTQPPHISHTLPRKCRETCAGGRGSPTGWGQELGVAWSAWAWLNEWAGPKGPWGCLEEPGIIGGLG